MRRRFFPSKAHTNDAQVRYCVNILPASDLHAFDGMMKLLHKRPACDTFPTFL